MPAHDSINVFGGFAPFPNSIMIPTMGLQSDVIGFRFGFGYEKGKRSLRAMSNEEFNSLNEEAEQAIYKRHDTTAINFFKMELQNWTDLQHDIIEKSVEIEKMKAQRTPSAMAEIIQSFNTALASQGQTVTWENLRDTWETFFGGHQIFNNIITSGQTQGTGGGGGNDDSGGRGPGDDNVHGGNNGDDNQETEKQQPPLNEKILIVLDKTIYKTNGTVARVEKQHYKFTFTGHKTKLKQLANFYNQMATGTPLKEMNRKTILEMVSQYQMKLASIYFKESFNIIGRSRR